ncbi:MAG TPA: lytic transglycosylase domain-containing protein [Rubrivivax sp.]|nr:lytic transglycosylase domain-containing protein [Rubrivivax sp.]
MSPVPGGVSRRRACAGATLALLGLGLSPGVHAGAQLEEPLADKVRSALAASVADSAPPRPSFASIDERLTYLRWLGAMSERMKKRKSEHLIRVEFLEAVWYESKRAGLEPALVLGLIQVESGFRKYAISSAGARGYMQVMPFWARTIGTGDASRLFHMQTNLRFGCVILRHYLDIEKGDLFLALGRYNGSRGRSEYPSAVFANRRLWMLDDAVPAMPVLPVSARSGG